MRATARKPVGYPNSTLAAVAIAFAAAIVIVFLADLNGRYHDALARAHQATRNYAEVLAADAARTFNGVDRALRVAEIAHREIGAGPFASEAERIAAAARAHDTLNQIQRTSPMIVAIGWTDAAGDVLANSHDRFPAPRNVAARAYFAAQRDADLAHDRLFVAPPFHSSRTGNWLTAASRRLTDADGNFVGVVNATLDPAYFAGIYRSIDIGASGTVMLFHRTGVLLAREPHIESAIGRSFIDAPLFRRYLPAAEAGNFEIDGFYNGKPRIAGYREVPGLPLVVLVNVDRAEILASWYHHLYTFGPMIAFVVVAMLLGAAALMRQTRRIAEKSSVLEMTLDNMTHGLVMIDSDLRLIVCNRQFADMYGLRPELTKPGTPLRAVLEARRASGNGPRDGHDFIERRLAAAASQKPSQVVMQLGDGRAVAVTHQPVPGKGAVSIHQDITAEKRLEASLIAKSEELERANMLFDAALNNMSQGLCMFDASLRLVVANSRFGEMYGLTSAQMRPGTTVRQIFEYRVANGNYDAGVSPDEFLTKAFRETSEIQTLGNGRVVSILRLWLPDGGVLTTHEDITDRRQNEAKVAFMAHHDLLTGLANRTFFAEKIDEAGARLRRRGETFAVFMLDLDRFKDVNDSLGHPAGDALLKEMAQRLKSSLRETDVLARLGGDEFAILQSSERNQRDEAIALAVRIIEIVAQPFDLDGRKVSVGTSIGIALAPQDGTEPDELLKRADLALYRTKAAGRNGFNFFHADMTAEVDARHRLENEMREGLARNEFELHYQPVFDSETREVRGAEALVRWRHPQRGLMAPDRFIPLAEDTGLIVQLGAWILQRACADAVAWPDQVKLAINLSSVQFRKGDLFDIILCALVDSGLPPERLEVEITESVLLENETNYRRVLQQLKNIGVSIVLDDFGTGYSSLGYLTTFPVDKIKIDKSFTQGLIERAECAAVIASVLTLARGMDIETTAEGVETEEQYDMLRAAGVNLVQGFLFGEPCAVSELRFRRAEIAGQATAAA
jgi:diguanylate cyclase (GGDEF)-like protein